MNPPRPLLRQLYYWILPTLFMGALVALYFSGRPELVDVIAPRIAPWSEHGNREFGLLENAQHLILAIAALVLFRGALRVTVPLQRFGFVMLAAAFTLMLLEEIDYGLHYWEWWQGQVVFNDSRNLHNRGDTTQRLKVAADAINLLWFLVLPLLALRLNNPWLRYFAPPTLILSTVAVALGVSHLTHQLADLGLQPQIAGAPRLALAGNVSEFRETVVYYVWLLYAYEVVVRRRWPGASG